MRRASYHCMVYQGNMAPSPSGTSASFVTRSTLSAIRSFSTAPARQARKVPPVSPDYVRLNLPKQIDDQAPPRVRGFLPVPREIFPRKDGKRKVSNSYIQQTAARPTARQPKSREQQEKALLAETRRKNLNQGLKELWTRQNQEKNLRSLRSKRNHERNHAMATAPERKDDVYTRGTTLDALLDTKVYEDAKRFPRADRRRDKNISLMKAKQEVRKDALMDLYVSATNFITNESELRAKIDELFDASYMRNLREARNGTYEVDNAWGALGPPPSLNAMLGANTSISHSQAAERASGLTTWRQKKIAETLTGGKMDDAEVEQQRGRESTRW